MYLNSYISPGYLMEGKESKTQSNTCRKMSLKLLNKTICF